MNTPEQILEIMQEMRRAGIEFTSTTDESQEPRLNEAGLTVFKSTARFGKLE